MDPQIANNNGCDKPPLNNITTLKVHRDFVCLHNKWRTVCFIIGVDQHEHEIQHLVCAAQVYTQVVTVVSAEQCRYVCRSHVEGFMFPCIQVLKEMKK